MKQFLSAIKSPLTLFVITLAAITIATNSGPPEKTLGVNVRIVYLHGAWVWAALVMFAGSAIVGLISLIINSSTWAQWSRALARAGIFFWITYLPISLWAMQANWNGLFLAEPRWRIAVVFAIGGFILQLGLAFLNSLRIDAAINILFLAGLAFSISTSEQVMHPPLFLVF